MKKIYTLSIAIAALLTATTATAETDNTRMLIRQRTYGDVLGESSTSKCTAEKVYYYNNNLQLRRIINTKPGTSDLIFQTTDYMTYEYKNGLLDEVAQWQYGVYTYGERDIKKSNTGNIKYKYDTNGNCIEENNDDMITRYEYNANNVMVKMIEPSGKTTTYDQLTADGKPLHATVRPAMMQNLGDSYEMIYTYNANGKLTSLLRQHDEDLKVEIGRIGSFIMYDEVFAGDFVQEDVYEYNGDFLKQVTTYGIDYSSASGKGPLSKTVYEMVNGNPNIIRYYELSYDSWGTGWATKPTVIFEDEYQDFSDYKDLENEIVSATQSTTEANTALVEFNLPLRAYTDPNVGMNVYRNGEFLQTFYLNNYESYEYNNLIDNEDRTTFTFIDRGLKNGSYEYFVETVRSMVDPNAPAPDPEEMDNMGIMPLIYIPSYIVSNVARVNITTILPAMTNLKANYAVNNGAVTVSYDVPANASDFGFISNQLMVDNAQIGESETTSLTANSLTCNLTTGDHRIYILTRYTYGLALSEEIIVNIGVVPTGITEANATVTNTNPVYYDLSGRRITAPTLSRGIVISNEGGKTRKVCK